MKPLKTVLATAVLAGTAGLATAIPYASGISVGSTTIAHSAGTSITYTLNHAAATATVQILDSGNNVVATFAGTTAAGVNTVNWDGTGNNAGGTPVAGGSGYRVRVAVTGTEAAGWNRYKANTGTGNSNPLAGTATDLVADWFPKGIAVNTDPDSDFFGTTLVGFGYITDSTVFANASAVVEFRSDLSVKAGDNGYASRVLRHPNDDETLPHPRSYTTWGLCWDPTDSNRVWVTGQATSGAGANGTNAGSPNNFTALGVGGVLPQFRTNADPSTLIGTVPRTVRVHQYGSTKYAFYCRGNGIVEVATVNASNELATLVGNILAAEFGTASRYSKQVLFDSAGNMYWVNNRTAANTATADGKLYRWDSATVQAAIANPAGAPLTTANAAWIVTNDLTVRQRIVTAAIAPNGDVYVLSGNDGQGLYKVGNTSTATLTLNLSTLTAEITKTEFRPGTSAINDAATDMQFDAAGNLIVTEGGAEHVMGWSPGGASSTAFTAPPSQTITIQAPASVGTWMLQQY
ncbi:MAG: hypothetical protein KF858_16035 [Candidatus Sumerlaeia bacterium]|nr:hypothetical protein [Candidatus Sumerlaeia bacterium]